MRVDLPTARAALWTLRASRAARRQADRSLVAAVSLPPVPDVPLEAERGVNAVLRRRRESCLTRASVRQAWFAAHGVSRDLVIGVTAPSSDFRAHAWLDGDPPCHDEGYHELLRRPGSG
jgi:hypothetical protein